jgi:hypothetical protein
VEDAFWVFRISYLYLTLVGFTTMVVVASLVTLATGPNDPRKMRRDLLSPLVHRFLPPMDDTCDKKVAETLLVNETVSARSAPRGLPAIWSAGAGCNRHRTAARPVAYVRSQITAT